MIAFEPEKGCRRQCDLIVAHLQAFIISFRLVCVYMMILSIGEKDAMGAGQVVVHKVGVTCTALSGQLSKCLHIANFMGVAPPITPMVSMPMHAQRTGYVLHEHLLGGG